MPNMTPYEPTVADLEFIKEQAKQAIEVGSWDEAIKSIATARLLEDSLIIYRIGRSPSRKVFHVQAGRKPPEY